MAPFKLNKYELLMCFCIRHCDFIDKDKIVQLYNELGDESVFKFAKHNGLASIVAHTLIICFGEHKVGVHWIEEYRSIANKLEAYMREMDKVALLLANHGVPLLALKNSGIARGLYPHLGACPMGDIDVLVRESDFRSAHELLVAQGYTLKFRCEFEEDSLEAAEHGGGAEYSVELENGKHLWFELQWRPVAGRWIQPEQEPKADELVERSIAIDGSKVRLLSPEDNLLQVSLHTAKHTFVRAPGFRLHTDVDRIVSTQEIDWDRFVEMVINLKTKTAVYISLSMAKTLLNTPIPEDALKQIKPSVVKIRIMQAWLERVGIFDPDSPKWSKLGYIIFVSLLYDSVADFMRGVFPCADQMKSQYGFNSNLLLPYYHVKRLFQLLVNRVNT